MALARQSIDVPFAGGLETKQAEPLIQPVKLTRLENALFSRPGQLAKRNGYKALGATGVVGAFSGSLTALDQELVLAGAGALLSYGAARDAWVSKGSLRSPRVSTRGIYADTGGQQHPDCATAGGVTLYAWEQLNAEGASTGVMASVVDETSGAVLVGKVLVDAAGSAPRCVAAGANLYVVYAKSEFGGTFSLRWKRVSVGAPTAFASGTLVGAGGDFGGSNLFSIKATGGGDFFLVYTRAAGNGIWAGYVTSLGALAPQPQYPAPATWGNGAPVTSLNACLLGGFWYVLFSLTTTPYAATLPVDTLALTGPTALAGAQAANVLAMTAALDAGAQRVFFEVAPANGGPTYNTVTRTLTVPPPLAGLGALADLRRSVGLASEAWTDPTDPAGGALVWLTYDDTTQPTLFCVNSAGTVIAKALSEYGGGLTGGSTNKPQLASAVLLPGGKSLAFAFNARGRFVSQAGQVTFFTRTVRRVTLDFSAERYRSAQLGQGLHLAGGVLSGYDGTQIYEAGFHLYPPRPSGSSGSLGHSIPRFSSDGAIPQVTTLQVPPDDTSAQPVVHSGARFRPGQYWIWFDSDSAFAAQAFYLWFTVDGAGSDPFAGLVPPGGVVFKPIRVDLLGSDSQAGVCFKIADAVAGTINSTGFGPWVPTKTLPAGDSPTQVQFTSLGATGPFTMPVDDTSMGYSVIRAGTVGQSEITRLIFPAGAWISSGQWFLLESSHRDGATIPDNTVICFYFVVDGVAPNPVPAPPNTNQQIAIGINSTDDAATVASKAATAIVSSRRSAEQLWSQIHYGPIVETTCIVDVGGGFHPIYTTCGIGGQRTHNFSVGGGMDAGTRQYVATYEGTDARGQWHVSAPSLPFTSLSADKTIQGAPALPSAPGGSFGNNQVTKQTNLVSVPTLRLTRRNGLIINGERVGGVQVGLWRTIAAEDGGATIFYRVGTKANDPTVDAISFTDAASDQDILNADVLYTSTGALENIAPPPCQVVVQHRRRLLAADLDDENLIWISKELVDGYAPAWSDLLTRRVDATGGRITALGSMDDKVVVFKASRILVFGGDGPDDTGGNGAFTAPEIINTDVGCVNHDSVVFTQAGLMFQSQKGIYLLGRDLTASPIGTPVERYASAPITSAVLLPDSSQVRFTTSSGITLLYDYVAGQWSVFTCGAVHAEIWNGLHHRVDAAGVVYQETPGGFTDQGVPVALLVQTAWLKPGEALQGFMRARRMTVLGQYLSKHKLEVKVAVDYDETVRQTLLFDAGAALGANFEGNGGAYGNDPIYGGAAISAVEQVRGALGALVQKCEAIRFTIREIPGDEGAGLILQGLALELGIKGPTYKVAPNRRAS